MKQTERYFPPEMKDFLLRLGMSRAGAPGSWSVVWNPVNEGDNVFSSWLYPATSHVIIDKSKSLQFLNVGTLTVSAVSLKRGHGIVIQERPVDLKSYVRGEKKIFYGFRMGKNVLYYCVTTWPREGLPAVLKARALLDQLSKGDRKSDFLPYLPESPVVEHIAARFGLRWVHCRHKEYYYRDRRFRYISIEGQLAKPSLKAQVFLFDRGESLQWLRSQAKPVPEYEKTPLRRIARRVNSRTILVLTEELSGCKNAGQVLDLRAVLGELARVLEGGDYDLSAIDISTVHTVDPAFEWRSMLGRF